VTGGLELTVKHMAETQARLGHDVVVLTSNTCSFMPSVGESVNGVNVSRIKSLKLIYSDLTFPLERPDLESDIVHLHSQNSLFCLRVAQYSKKKGTPRLYQFLGVGYLKDHPKWLIRCLGSKYQDWIQIKALDLADRVVTPSPKDHKVLAEKYDVDSAVIPHGISREYLEKAPNPHLFRETYHIGEERIILYVGRLDPLKGMDVLIKALPHLKQRFDDCALAIAGTGSRDYVARLMVLAKSLGMEQRVIFLGYVEEEMKISALDAASVIVLPSVAPFETFPMVVNEAWARGKPVIVSAVGALPFRVNDMENGMLVPAGEPRMLAESLAKMLSDSKLQMRLGQAGRKELKTWEQVANLTVKLYEQVLN